MTGFIAFALSDKEIAQVECYRKSFGDKWADGRLTALRAGKYREATLEQVKDKGGSASPYRCYSEGTTVYRRKDGQPVSEEDIASVDYNMIGQGHEVVAKPGDMEIVHKWFVDSSD